MTAEDNLVKTFAGCFRLLMKLNIGVKDLFFSNLCGDEADKLLAEYIKFLKKAGDRNNSSHVAQKGILQHKENVAKYSQIVQHGDHVAQSGREIIYCIGNILNLLAILRHLKLLNQTTSLLLEKELLFLKSSVLDFKKQSSKSAKNRKGDRQPSAKLLKDSVQKPVFSLNQSHNEIASFVRSKGKVRNIEIFTKFTDTTKRTTKKKLSELVKAGVIKRIAAGKKVFYIATK